MRTISFATARNERGVALPLALLGLVSVSLLVTTALVTSTTELAISAAHQDATDALYAAEGGLQAYVAQNGTGLQNIAGQTFAYTPPGGTPVSLTVAPLGVQTLTNPAGALLRLYSVTAAPSAGGRTVSAMVTQILPAPVALSTNITSALTLGGDLDLDGNSFTVSGQSTNPACGAGVEAVRTAGEVTIDANNVNHLNNFSGVNDSGQTVTGAAAIVETTLSAQQLSLDVLNGMTLEELIEWVPAANKWGPRFSTPGQPVRVFDGVVDSSEHVAIIDANGGTIELNGGSGIVIILNGDLEMGGGDNFNGIVIVEGAFRLHGNLNVIGALISLSYSATSTINVDEESGIDGAATVQYNRCEIDAAANAWGQLTQQTQVPLVRSTVSWLEVVR